MAFGWLKKAVKATTGAVGSVGKLAGKVPIVGKGLRGAFVLTVGAPFEVANAVASGQRIDKVALGTLSSQLGAIRDVAPYAQTIVSVVPGVGQGVSGAIAASLALAQGKNITTALTEAVKNSLPGGPLAKAGFDLAEAAIQGKPLDAIALAALPLSAEQKQLVATGLATAKDIAAGKRVDTVLLNKALSVLPPDVQKAVNVGMALGNGKILQAAKASGLARGGLAMVFPAKGAPISKGIRMADTVVKAANSRNPRTKAEAKAVVQSTLKLAATGNVGARNAATLFNKRAAALRTARCYQMNGRTGRLSRRA